MNISDEAVEAAKAVLLECTNYSGLINKHEVRKALKAAARHLMAAAWDQGAEAGAILQHHVEAAKQSGAGTPGPIFNPYRERS